MVVPKAMLPEETVTGPERLLLEARTVVPVPVKVREPAPPKVPRKDPEPDWLKIIEALFERAP